MSAKKDGLVNMGGFIGFKNKEIYRQACTYNIMFEGFITYGGMSGRDMNALAQGLDEGTDFDYLEGKLMYRLPFFLVVLPNSSYQISPDHSLLFVEYR